MIRKLYASIIALGFVAISSMSIVPAYAEEDTHFIQPDDYFISSDAYRTQAWISVYLAKMQETPTKETKNEAKFLQVIDGKEVWTKNYYKTVIAAKSDIKIGTIMIALDVAGEGDVYRAPESKDEARTANWFIAKITDVSDLYKGYVTVSGGYKVKIDAMRVIVKEPKGR
jgi:hypothetical protein